MCTCLDDVAGGDTADDVGSVICIRTGRCMCVGHASVSGVLHGVCICLVVDVHTSHGVYVIYLQGLVHAYQLYTRTTATQQLCTHVHSHTYNHFHLSPHPSSTHTPTTTNFPQHLTHSHASTPPPFSRPHLIDRTTQPTTHPSTHPSTHPVR